MVQVTLRPMGRTEFDAWRPRAVAEYANDHARAGSMPADRALEMAEKQFTDLLPDGPETRDHHLLVPESDGAAIGVLWLYLPGDIPGATADGRQSAFVYDVEVAREMRGRGFGRAVMLAAERYARERGATSMRLHVFGENLVARRLYESLGYTATNISMAKSLAVG